MNKKKKRIKEIEKLSLKEALETNRFEEFYVYTSKRLEQLAKRK